MPMDLKCLQHHMRGQTVCVEERRYQVNADGILTVSDADAKSLMKMRGCYTPVVAPVAQKSPAPATTPAPKPEPVEPDSEPEAAPAQTPNPKRTPAKK